LIYKKITLNKKIHWIKLLTLSTKKTNQVNKKNSKKEEELSSSEDEITQNSASSSDSEDETPVKKTNKKVVKKALNKPEKVTPKKITPKKTVPKKNTPKKQGSSSSSSSKDRYDEDEDDEDNENEEENNKNNLNKVFNEGVNSLLLTFLKPITDYYKEEYNATETPKDIANIIEKPLVKRGRGKNVKTKKGSIPKGKICKYIISEGKPTERNCEKEKIENSDYCESHKKMMDKKAGNVPESDEKFPPCSLIENKKIKVSKFPEKEKDIRNKNLFLYEKRFLVEGVGKKINIICKISEFESNYIVKPLTEADKGYFKQYDDINFKNLDYLFDTIYASYDENDIPFKRE